MKTIELKDCVEYADFLQIVFADKCVEVFLGNERCLNYTFNEIMREARKNGWKDGTILLIAESPLSGKVYQYGNYGAYWVEHGTTVGYA